MLVRLSCWWLLCCWRYRRGCGTGGAHYGTSGLLSLHQLRGRRGKWLLLLGVTVLLKHTIGNRTLVNWLIRNTIKQYSFYLAKHPGKPLKALLLPRLLFLLLVFVCLPDQISHSSEHILSYFTGGWGSSTTFLTPHLFYNSQNLYSKPGLTTVLLAISLSL